MNNFGEEKKKKKTNLLHHCQENCKPINQLGSSKTSLYGYEEREN